MASRAISSLGWRVVARQSKAEALAPVDAQTRSNLFLLVVITAIVGATAVFLARLITNPIIQLKTLADKVASGDLDAEAKVTTRDEVGVLAATFNNMTSQLKNLVGSLEQRVSDRTPTWNWLPK
jgi:nitrate/nitrite-specific signal transduction histidine kinase